jgi:hypothetical protein
VNTEIGIEQAPETKKLNTIDFNIKGFLLEMRNKHISNETAGVGESKPKSQQ